MSLPGPDVYPAVTANKLAYVRGDGAKVTITIDPPPGGLKPYLPITPSVAFITPQPVPPQLVAPLEGVPAAQTQRPQPTSAELFDHPTIGGKLTMFVLLYGPRSASTASSARSPASASTCGSAPTSSAPKASPTWTG
jgi:hypothetical protein